MLYNLIAFSAAVATGTADADCVGYFYKINGVCTGVQQFGGATGCGLAEGGKDSHPRAVDRAFCEEFGTARVPADQQVSMKSWGNLGKPGAATFAGEVNDPSMPSGCVAHANSNTYQWNNAANGAVTGWWRLVCMTEAEPTPPPTPQPLDCPGYYYKINGECTGVQQFPGATGCGLAAGGKDSFPKAVDRAFCEDFGTARVPADQQVSMKSWGNLGKPGAASFAGEVNDPSMPSGCIAYANSNIYQWNNAANGAVTGWWRVVCMTDPQPQPTPRPTEEPSVALAPPTMDPTEMTKCKDYNLDRAMSIKNGANSEAVQLCKVINGNVMSPMWGNGKDSDCGTDAALIAASTNSIADCQALCDAHSKCLGWWLWDQSRNTPPYQKDDQGCYLFEHGTADQLVPDRVFGDNSAVAAGVCFPEPRVMTKCKDYTPDRAMSIKNGANSEAVQLCKVINGNVMSPMWGNGKDSDCGTDAALIAASTNSIADCQALCDAHVKCLGWWLWDQSLNSPPYQKDDQGCYLFEFGTADQLVPDRVFGDNSAVAAGVCFPETAPPTTSPPTTAPPTTAPPTTAPPTPAVTNCQKVMLKSGDKCLHDQGPNATAMWVTCPAPGSDDPKFKFDIVPVDPSNPNLVKIINSRGQYLSYQSPWQESVMTRAWMPQYDQEWELRTSANGGVQFYNPVRAAYMSSNPAVNHGFAGFTTDASDAMTSFDASSAGCAGLTPPPTVPPSVATGVTSPPSAAPAATCDCRLTDDSYAQGGRCIGKLGESIGYRQTANWCCSAYGCSKGYTWMNPGQCHDDTFIGTCVFNFIQAGGCAIDAVETNPLVLSSVDPDCFECPNIGDLVENECKASAAQPIKILNDMIDDARRLEHAPLPADDDMLRKINRKISKIRNILKEKKQASKAAQQQIIG